MSATSVRVAPSGECLWGEGLMWLVGAVVCLLAALWVKLSISAGSGWPHAMLQHHALALADPLPIPRL